MILKTLCTICIAVGIINSLPTGPEPTCTSHFDYMDKLLEKVVRFETKMEMIESQFKSFTDIISDFKETLKPNSDRNKAFISTQLTAMSEMEKSLMTNIEMSNQTLKSLKEQVDSEIQAMIANAYKQIDDIKDRFAKKDVVFRVTDFADQPTASSILKFKTVLSNTENVYNRDTGFFTAPDGGTYYFAIHLCVNPKKDFITSIYKNDILINSGYVRDNTFVSCSTTTAVTVMRSGDRVYVKATLSIGSSPLHRNPPYFMNTFMGARIN